ncbi:MAG: hypothetical protein SGILL_007878 [Bacillariaceae sp.]
MAAAARFGARKALIVVPPFLNYSAGPLLGPVLLQAAATKAGHECEVKDLNAHWIRQHLPVDSTSTKRTLFVGDHDKPMGALRRIEDSFYKMIANPFPTNTSNRDTLMRNIRFGFLEHQEIKGLGKRAASTSFGHWVRTKLDEQASPPNVLGVSLLHAGQVVPSVAISMIARDLWPGVTVAWGGPHISGLEEDAIQFDLHERQYAADIFVPGHAEQTFVDLLDSCSRQSKDHPLFRQGSRGSAPVTPIFGDLSQYDMPPVLPAQSTLGCAYGRCAFCTYPKMEPVPSKLDLCLSVESVVEQAVRVQGTVALKDSLVTPRRLQEIADVIQGKAQWSACTKLHPKLVDEQLLQHLADNGLATLEVGLESLLLDTQRRVAKVHRPGLFGDFLKSVENIPELSIVVNYITDFPWESMEDSQAGLDRARYLVEKHVGTRRGKVEHNSFELERMSPMAQDPEKYDICDKSLKFWPWASIVEYERK